MQLICPACDAAFTGVSRCPRCGGLLLMPDEAAFAPVGPAAPAAHLHLPPAARVVVGTVLALGLYLALRKLTLGLVLATEADPAGWWLTAEGLSSVFGLQAAAGLFGALVAAAGRARGAAIGGAVGGLCGGLFLAAEVGGGAPAGQLVLYLQPILLAAGGGLAGAVGARVWAAVPDLDMPAPRTKKASSIQLDADPPRASGRPTAWVRVLVGAAVIVAGVGLADTARSKAQRSTGGALKVSSIGQGRFISWQLATLAVLAGGGVAAAGTGAGLRHGLLAGFFGATGVIWLTAAQGTLAPPAVYMLDRLAVGGNDPSDPLALATLAGGVLLAGLVGGWFGGQIVLPLAPAHMRARRVGGD